MVLLELALQVVNDPTVFRYEDILESYQFINDTGITDKLNPIQFKVLTDLIESGQVVSTPWRM